jgi:hypothetical protein
VDQRYQGVRRRLARRTLFRRRTDADADADAAAASAEEVFTHEPRCQSGDISIFPADLIVMSVANASRAALGVCTARLCVSLDLPLRAGGVFRVVVHWRRAGSHPRVGLPGRKSAGSCRQGRNHDGTAAHRHACGCAIHAACLLGQPDFVMNRSYLA